MASCLEDSPLDGFTAQQDSALDGFMPKDSALDDFTA
jgi:hypothetical protein